jgi:hypothetical protein
LVYLFSFLGALSYALASVLQQTAAYEAPPEHNMNLGLMTYLIKRKVWLAGITFDGLGYVLQAVALNFGPLSLVEPLFVTGLLFALPLGAAIKRRMLNRMEWFGGIAVTAGLATFVRVTQPKEGNYSISPTLWIGFGAVVVFMALLAWLIGKTGRGAWQAVAIGMACGIAFSFGTSLTKYLTDVLSSGGVSSVIANPALYALIVDGAISMLMSQSAFQAGPLQSSLPALTVSEPVVSSLVGVTLFHEHIDSGVSVVTIAVAMALVITAGIVILARQDSRGQTGASETVVPAG